MDMKKYSCPYCTKNHTIKRGTREGKNRYFCLDCGKWFQINRLAKKYDVKQMAFDHLNGFSFRTLAVKYNLSVGTAYKQVIDYLNKLPHLVDITRDYCSCFSKILLVDGKFVSVGGYGKKIPVIYGIDYLSHDIVNFTLAPSENYQALKKFFSSLYLAGYQMSMLVSDDNLNIREAGKYVYPSSHFQLCQTHYQRHLVNQLNILKEPTHKQFMNDLNILFGYKYSRDNFNRLAQKLLLKYQTVNLYASILLNIAYRQDQLQGHLYFKHTPLTTNLIEGFNSHLESRVKPLKGFTNLAHAKLWFNAYFIKRRFQKFTDCSGKFKKLNGYSSIEKTKKPHIDLPTFF